MKQTFGDFLKKKRIERMFKLNTFARMVGISPVYASYLENGKRPAPSERVLKAIMKQLALNEDEADRLMLLAAETRRRPAVPSDLIEYIYDHKYVVDAIRAAKEHNTSETEWLAFTERISK